MKINDWKNRKVSTLKYRISTYRDGNDLDKIRKKKNNDWNYGSGSKWMDEKRCKGVRLWRNFFRNVSMPTMFVDCFHATESCQGIMLVPPNDANEPYEPYEPYEPNMPNSIVNVHCPHGEIPSWSWGQLKCIINVASNEQCLMHLKIEESSINLNGISKHTCAIHKYQFERPWRKFYETWCQKINARFKTSKRDLKEIKHMMVRFIEESLKWFS